MRCVVLAVRRRWLVAAMVVVCCVAAGGPTRVAEAAESRFVYVALTSTFPTGVCSASYGGFLPNLYTPVRDRLFGSSVLITESNTVEYPLSGTIGSSPCTTDANCVWQWREGPFSLAPLTFFYGTTVTSPQPANLGLYYRWRPNDFLGPRIFPRAYYTMSSSGWRTMGLFSSVSYIGCEVLDGTKYSTAEPPPPVAAPKPSGSKWWIGLIIAIVVIVAFISAVIIFFRCCRNRNRRVVYDPDREDEFEESKMDASPPFAEPSPGYYDGGGGMMSRQPSYYDGGGAVMSRQPSYHDGGGAVMSRQLSYHDGGGGMMSRQPSYHDGGGGMMSRQPSYHDGGGGMMSRHPSCHDGGDMVQGRQWFVEDGAV